MKGIINIAQVLKENATAEEIMPKLEHYKGIPLQILAFIQNPGDLVFLPPLTAYCIKPVNN
jgi:hypothetical protein